MAVVRFGRPGLLSALVTDDLVGGSNTAMSTNVLQRQSRRAAEQARLARALQAAAGAEDLADGRLAHGPGDLVERLAQLAQLRDGGTLSEAEFQAAKHRLLAG